MRIEKVVSTTLDQFEGQSLDQDQRVDIADVQDINFELTRGYAMDYFDCIQWCLYIFLLNLSLMFLSNIISTLFWWREKQPFLLEFVNAYFHYFE